jgi:hypothetical protein
LTPEPAATGAMNTLAPPIFMSMRIAPSCGVRMISASNMRS